MDVCKGAGHTFDPRCDAHIHSRAHIHVYQVYIFSINKQLLQPSHVVAHFHGQSYAIIRSREPCAWPCQHASTRVERYLVYIYYSITIVHDRTSVLNVRCTSQQWNIQIKNIMFRIMNIHRKLYMYVLFDYQVES